MTYRRLFPETSMSTLFVTKIPVLLVRLGSIERMLLATTKCSPDAKMPSPRPPEIEFPVICTSRRDPA